MRDGTPYVFIMTMIEIDDNHSTDSNEDIIESVPSTWL